MRQLRRLIMPAVLPPLLLPLLLLVACASQAKLPALPQPPQQLELYGSSFMPPAEHGWRIAGRTSDRLLLGRQGPSPEETEILKAGTSYTQIFHSPDEFESFIRDRIAGDSGPADRFSVSKNELTMVNHKGNDCARVHLTTIDRQAKSRSGKPGDLTLETIELFCRHPDNDGVVTYLGYSQSYYPGDRVPDFNAKAARLLESLVLYPF